MPSDFDATARPPAVTFRRFVLRAILTWHQLFSSEDWYDCGYVEASTDGGATWTKVTPEEGYNYQWYAGCGGAAITGSFSGYGVNQSWTPYTLDMNAFAGQEVQLRFVFRSDGSVTGPGWYLDDFILAVEEPEE